jgi:hypothetical protein
MSKRGSKSAKFMGHIKPTALHATGIPPITKKKKIKKKKINREKISLPSNSVGSKEKKIKKSKIKRKKISVGSIVSFKQSVAHVSEIESLPQADFISMAYKYGSQSYSVKRKMLLKLKEIGSVQELKILIGR